MRHIAVALALAILIALVAHTGFALYRGWRSIAGTLSPLGFGLGFGLAVAGTLALFVSSRIPNIGIPRGLLQLSHYLLGLFAYLVLFVNAVELLLLLGRLLRLIPSPRPAAVSAACLLSTALALGLFTCGVLHARNIRTVFYDVTLHCADTQQSEPLRIALVSDLHLGYMTGEAQLRRIIDAIEAAEPDLVCIAGDIFDGDMTALSDPGALKALFRSIRAPYGVYACLGNHDSGASQPQMLSFLEDAGVRLLSDEAAAIDGRILLVGRRDSSPIGGRGVRRSAVVPVPADNPLPVVVLDHQPGNLPQYGAETDLLLCGHTHKGQMFPGNLLTRRLYLVDYGYYHASDASPQVIVTSGAGTWGPPLRLGSSSEIALITLRLSE